MTIDDITGGEETRKRVFVYSDSREKADQGKMAYNRGGYEAISCFDSRPGKTMKDVIESCDLVYMVDTETMTSVDLFLKRHRFLEYD